MGTILLSEHNMHFNNLANATIEHLLNYLTVYRVNRNETTAYLVENYNRLIRQKGLPDHT